MADRAIRKHTQAILRERWKAGFEARRLEAKTKYLETKKVSK